MRAHVTLRDLFWATLVAALAVGWFSDRQHMETRFKRRDEHWRRAWLILFRADTEQDGETEFRKIQGEAP